MSILTVPLSAGISGIGLIAPGIPDWASGRSVLQGTQPLIAAASILPTPGLLPPAERRRASRVVKLALALGLEAAAHARADPATLATVFAASGADGHNCHALCEQLAGNDRRVSPTRFHNSVHNAAAGYWGIASRAMAPCQVLCAYDGSFGAGLLDALAQVMVEQRPVLLIVYDSEYPSPLHEKRPVPDCAGVALLLNPTVDACLARISVAASKSPADTLSEPALETLRTAVPAMRVLPLLTALARRQAGTVTLDYLAQMQLAVTVSDCIET
jgi:hypothetical protein